MKNISKSLAKFHELMGNVAKDASNPFFKSKYAPLESILPAIKKPLADAGLVFVQTPTGICKLKTTIIDVESGEFIEGEFEMTPTKNDPQGQGSTITYMRRYSLVAMLGLNCDDDDDANTASQAPKAKKPVEVKMTPQEALKNAKSAIEESNNIETLNKVGKNIQSSKILTETDKETLLFELNEKREGFDPLKD